MLKQSANMNMVARVAVNLAEADVVSTHAHKVKIKHLEFLANVFENAKPCRCMLI